ncbi:G-protein coupled receptor 151 [Gastrophryne carolinensis]
MFAGSFNLRCAAVWAAELSKASGMERRNFSITNSSLPQNTLPAGGFPTPEGEEWALGIPAVLIAICLLGLAGNLCVIVVLFHSSRKAKPSLIHALILNLSFSDLLLLMFSVPFRVAAYSRSTSNFGWFVCKTADWFTHACMSAKSFSLAIAARACFIYASNAAKQVSMGHLTISALLVCTWLVSAVLPLPEWLFTDARQTRGSFTCLMNIPAHAQQVMAIFVKVYPVVVYCIPFTLAFINFWRAYGQCQHRGTKTQNLRTQIPSRRHTLMLLSVTITFCILWLPEWVSWLWIWHQPPSGPSPPPALVTSAQILMFSLSCANPLIFLLMSEEFKEGFEEVWKCWTSKKTLPVHDSQDQGALNTEVPPDSTNSLGAVSEHPADHQGVQQSFSQQNIGSPDSKENAVFPDVEQFWHGRESNPLDADNDPVPWEHAEQETVMSFKSDTKL